MNFLALKNNARFVNWGLPQCPRIAQLVERGIVVLVLIINLPKSSVQIRFRGYFLGYLVGNLKMIH
jgi:hypothetical protein